MTGRIGAACLLGLCLLSSCRPAGEQQEDVGLEWAVTPSPPVTGTATVSLELKEKTGQPVEGAEVRLEGNMTHPGMTPVFATAREVGPGRYEAPLELTMGGDWIVLVDAKLRDGRTLQRELPLPGVRSP
jgi:nitrogen fixation protein FixH